MSNNFQLQSIHRLILFRGQFHPLNVNSSIQCSCFIEGNIEYNYICFIKECERFNFHIHAVAQKFKSRETAFHHEVQMPTAIDYKPYMFCFFLLVLFHMHEY